MIIPNKFNGYSADNRRVYNDPATMVVTISGMGEAAAATATAAEVAAAAAAAETAASTAAAAEAAQTAAAAQQAGQAGIMQGAAVPPPGATPPGVPGLGAPMPPATTPVPAGLTPGQQNFLNSSVSDVSGNTMPAETYNGGVNPAEINPVDPTALSQSSGQQLQNAIQNGGSQPQNYFNEAQGAIPESGAKPPMFGDNALGRGISQAADLVGKGYEGFKKAPMPLQGLGVQMAYQALNPPPEPPGPKKYKRQDMSRFQPTTPTQQNLQRSYEWQGYAVGGPVEQMSAMNSTGGNTMYPQANLQTPMYSNPMVQRPVAQNVINQGIDTNVDPYTGEQKFSGGGYAEDKEAAEQTAQRKRYSEMMGNRSSDVETDIAQGRAIAAKAKGSGAGIIPFEKTQKSPYGAAVDRYQQLAKKANIPVAKMPKTNLGNIDNYLDSMGSAHVAEAARGGIMYNLGGYSDGGRLLRGPGDGVSDSIPASIGNRQPARLADGEFVIPARIVSEIGNGSTEAGARKLYAMMERIQKDRKKSIGKGKVAVNSKVDKHLPA
jgi:hypothetical protein